MLHNRRFVNLEGRFICAHSTHNFQKIKSFASMKGLSTIPNEKQDKQTKLAMVWEAFCRSLAKFLFINRLKKAP